MVKNFYRNFIFASAICGTLICGGAFAQGSFKNTIKPLSLSEISKDYNLVSARISPDGKHIAAISGIEGQNPIIRVWDTSDMTKAPRQFGSKTMRFVSLSFIKNDKLFITTAEPLKQGAKSDWVFSSVISNLDGSKFIETETDKTNNTRDEDRVYAVELYSRLPLDDDNILIAEYSFNGVSIYKVNLKSGSKQRYARTGENQSFLWNDSNGVIKIKSELDIPSTNTYIQTYFVKDAEGNWKKMPALTENLAERYSLSFAHVTKDSKTVYLITDKGSNYATLRKYDVATDTLSAPIVANTDYSISSASFGTSNDEYAVKEEKVRSFCWNGPIVECQYLDEVDARIQAMLETALPGKIVNFTVKNDGKDVLVSEQAPNQPTTYYLLKDESKLIRIGSVLEGRDQTNLAPAEWVEYPARDGLKIPGVLYTPFGYNKERDGRIPLVVLPHGGPWASDNMDFDSSYWPQMFATRGFAVLQPNYRGSEGYGQKLWKSGDKEWGAKMQDDKDDGAKWLVEQGIADPNRMMMYGYSYGGFAAAAAAARSSTASAGLYQCAISGAPAISIERIKNDWGANRLSRLLQGRTVAGWDPQENLDKVKIPWMIIHGTYDHQADILHSNDAAATIKRVNPNAKFKYVTIDRMSHTLTEMLPEHKEQLAANILDWTANNCGNISASFKDAEATQIAKKYEKKSK